MGSELLTSIPIVEDSDEPPPNRHSVSGWILDLVTRSRPHVRFAQTAEVFGLFYGLRGRDGNDVGVGLGRSAVPA